MKHLLLTLAIMTMLSLPASAKTWTFRHGQTWDSYVANAICNSAQKGFANRTLYRQYRERMEVLNQQRLDQGLEPMPIKSFRDWRRCK